MPLRYDKKMSGPIPSYEERLKAFESLPQALQEMAHRPRKGEYSEKYAEINNKIKELTLNDLGELLRIIEEMREGEYYRPQIIR